MGESSQVCVKSHGHSYHMDSGSDGSGTSTGKRPSRDKESRIAPADDIRRRKTYSGHRLRKEIYQNVAGRQGSKNLYQLCEQITE